MCGGSLRRLPASFALTSGAGRGRGVAARAQGLARPCCHGGGGAPGRGGHGAEINVGGTGLGLLGSSPGVC